MRTYTQLTREQRYQIYALLKAGHDQKEIAQLIKVHKSTISRELQRNRGLRGYRTKQAHQFALDRRKKARYRIGSRRSTVFKSVMNGSTSTSSWINTREETFTAIYDAAKSAGSAMGAMIVVGRSRTG